MAFAFETVVTGAVFWVLLGLAASLTPRSLRKGSLPFHPRLAMLAAAAGIMLLAAMAAPALADALYGAARRMN